jgi:predicted membrane protein
MILAITIIIMCFVVIKLPILYWPLGVIFFLIPIALFMEDREIRKETRRRAQIKKEMERQSQRMH